MCDFFSFNVDKRGNVYFIQDKRCKDQTLNYDSHSYISERFGLNDDEVWKYELPVDIGTAAEWKKNPPSIEEVMEKWVKYDGGLPEDEMPFGVYKSMKEYLVSIIPHLYDYNLGSVELPEFIADSAKVIEYSRELDREDIDALLNINYCYNKNGDYWKDGNRVVYNRIKKPSKKILFYSYKHEYAKINENGEPIKIEKLRTVIKDIE